MRMIPSNVVANLLGLGYEINAEHFQHSTAGVGVASTDAVGWLFTDDVGVSTSGSLTYKLCYHCIGHWTFIGTPLYNGSNDEVKNDAPFSVNGAMSTLGATHTTHASVTTAAYVEFNASTGSTGYINFGNYYNFTFDEPFTIGVAVNRTAASTGSEPGTIASKMTTGGTGWRIGYNSSSKYFVQIASTVNAQDFHIETSAVQSTGAIVNFTYDGSQSATGLNIYIDGTTVALTTVANTTNSSAIVTDSLNNSDLLLASRDKTKTANYRGKISNFVIWNRAITEGDVTNWYNSGAMKRVEFEQFIPDVSYMVHMLEFQFGINYYFNDGDIDIVYDNGTGNVRYKSRGFEVPSVEYSLNPTVDKLTIEFDNVDEWFSTRIAAEDVRGKTVKFWLAALNGVPNVINRTLQFQGIIDSVTVTREKAVIEVFSHFILWQRQIPKRRHSSRCQWTFKDSVTCKYAAADTVCDKSWEDCLAKSNTINFGGFRWLPSLVDRQIWWGSIPS